MQSNVSPLDAMSVGEAKTVQFTVTDDAGNNVFSFTGWSVGWYLLRRSSTPGGLPGVASAAIIAKTTTDGAIDASTPPFLKVQLTADDSINLSGGAYAYELWRSDVGNERKLAYGAFPILS